MLLFHTFNAQSTIWHSLLLSLLNPEPWNWGAFPGPAVQVQWVLGTWPVFRKVLVRGRGALKRLRALLFWERERSIGLPVKSLEIWNLICLHLWVALPFKKTLGRLLGMEEFEELFVIGIMETKKKLNHRDGWFLFGYLFCFLLVFVFLICRPGVGLSIGRALPQCWAQCSGAVSSEFLQSSSAPSVKLVLKDKIQTTNYPHLEDPKLVMYNLPP